MSNAWKILTALTLARLSMGFQFQTVPALASPLTAADNLSFAALGTLTGAYLIPGVAAALGGGWLGHKLGDIRTALWGLALMSAGGFGGWWADSFHAALLWRVVAGCGAVGLSVMLNKMAADWFQDRSDLPTAMGVLVSSWPAGIAIALLVLPPVAATFGLGAALLIPAVLCAASLVLLAISWQPPKHKTTASTNEPGSAWLTSGELALVLVSGSIWGIYNLALISLIVWTPGFLQSQGVEEISAAAAVSLIGWAAIASVALGGWLATLLPWRDLPALAGIVLSAIGLIILPSLGALAASPWVMLAMGLVIGPAAAMIMTLPVEAARPHLRALTMGIYLAVYFAFMGVGPTAIGALRDMTGDPASPIYAASALLVLCLFVWAGFRIMQRQKTASTREL
jgi:cyanate permease